MATVIAFVLGNVPALTFVAALVVAAVRRDGRPFAARLLDFLLLLPSGVGMLWAGLFHVAFPEIAAASIGWQPSPFQFEIGVADLAAGATAALAFWRPLPFKAAAVTYVTLFYVGVAIGHVREAFASGDFASDNFGVLLVLTVVQAVLLPLLLFKAARQR